MDESALTSWIIGMSLKISEQLKNARNSTSRRLVTEAQNIVRERYMESEITLDDVCSALGVSNSYFSSIFKRRWENLLFLIYHVTGWILRQR